MKPLGGRVLHGTVVATGIVARALRVAATAREPSASTGAAALHATAPARCHLLLAAAVLLVVGLVVRPVATAARSGRAAHAAAASTAAIVAAEEATRAATAATTLTAHAPIVVHHVLVHLAVVAHHHVAAWTARCRAGVVRLGVPATSTGTVAARLLLLLLLLLHGLLLLLLGLMLLLLLLVLLLLRLLLHLAVTVLLLPVALTALELTVLAAGLARPALAPLLPPVAEAAPLLRRVLAALHRLALRPGHVGRLVALLADHHVELDLLAVADRPDRLLWVVARDRRLVHEHVLLRVAPVDETVAALHVEPFHHAGHLRRNHLLLGLGGCGGGSGRRACSGARLLTGILFRRGGGL
uniref:Uncharacterized protein n=1 Tax=Anopheles merus TaxID=30066 RepID=A0A182UYG1_ANOME